jgi:hypothetical protein
MKRERRALPQPYGHDHWELREGRYWQGVNGLVVRLAVPEQAPAEPPRREPAPAREPLLVLGYAAEVTLE